MKLKKQSKIIAALLSAVLLMGLVACGGSEGGSKAETNKDDQRLTAAQAAFNEYAPTLMEKTSGEMVISAENWSDSPSFDDIVAVSVASGLTPYQGTAKDALTVVSQPVQTDYADQNIVSTLKAALNDKGEVVLLWDEWMQTFPELEVQEPIVCNMSVSWDAANMLMRFNDTRQEQGLTPIAVEGSAVDVASPDAAVVPSQNSSVGDPDNMTESEQEAYNATQNNLELAEEYSDSQE